MRRLRILAASLLVALTSGLGVPAAVGAETPDPPRIVVVVGPVGGYTDFYRSVGAAAAQEARRWTPNVVTIASPDATWPAVRQALQGASIVVYLGHGNGFPSRYSPSPKPSTQNGLGLNPVAGGDDSAHQYFGEALLADRVRLAPHAIVILSHLCYASGNSEPGLPEPTVAVARQRIDNYAAGWVRAGAEAVIADTFGRPEAYIRALFAVHGTIADLWTGAPTFHDHIGVFPSSRSVGFEARMDPTATTARFNRSLVWRPGLTSVRSSPAPGPTCRSPSRTRCLRARPRSWAPDSRSVRCGSRRGDPRAASSPAPTRSWPCRS